MKLYKILVLAVILIFSLTIYSKTDQILEKGDVEKLIKTWPLMEKDLRKLGMKMDAKEGTTTIPEAYTTSREYSGIIKKHGWDKNFFNKVSIILSGYSYFQYKSGKVKASSQIEKSINDIKSNPKLSDEMKKQLINQIGALKGAMAQQGEALSQNINPKDLALIKVHLKSIKNLFDKKKK